MYKQKPSINSNSRPLRKRPIFLVLLAVVLLAAAAGGVLAYRHYQSQPDTVAERPRNSVNYDPPTDEEKQETEEFKKQQAQQSNPTPSPTGPDGRQQVTPVISYAGQYDASVEASAYVPNIIEDGGTCTMTFKNGSKTVTKTTSGIADAKTTRCDLFSFAAKELSPAGTWTATLKYESSKATGTSSSVNLEVK